jgi:hypothetical protein
VGWALSAARPDEHDPKMGILAPRSGRRHSFARHILANWVPINGVSLWLGHASRQTALLYLRLFRHRCLRCVRLNLMVNDPTGVWDDRDIADANFRLAAPAYRNQNIGGGR